MPTARYQQQEEADMVYSHLITIIALCILHPASAVADIFSDNGLDPVLSDEFNQDGTDILNTGSSSGWSLLHPERMTQVDSNLSLVNQLYYIPVADNQYAWFQDQYGSLLYKNCLLYTSPSPRDV